MLNNRRRIEKMIPKSKKVSSSYGMSLKKQKKHFKNIIKIMPKEALENQIQQILNYSDNTHDGYLPAIIMYENCSMLIKDYIDSDTTIDKDKGKEFKKSLDISQECMLNSKLYVNNIKMLKNNDKQSFIVAPICSVNHIFGTAIYKKDNNYEFTMINKGYTGGKDHTVFERYIISEDNLENIVKYLSIYSSYKNLEETEEIYKKFKENTISGTYERLPLIDARIQRAGNCYYKAIEEMLKYAYSEGFDRYEIDRFSHLHGKIECKIPKLPGGSQDFQQGLINNIKDVYDDKEFTVYVDNILDIYNKNKNFRKDMFKRSDLSFDERKEIFFEIFGDLREKTNDIKYLKKCLRNVDERTLQEHTEFFVLLLKEYNINIPLSMLNSMDMQLVDFTRYFDVYKEKNPDALNELEFYKEYFPKVWEVMDNLLKEDVDTILKYCVVADKCYNYDFAEKLIEVSLLREPGTVKTAKLYNALGTTRELQEYLKEALGYYKKAYDMSKNINVLIEDECRINHNKVLIQMTNKKKKLKDIDLKLKNNKNDINLLTEKAELQKSLGQLKLAIATYDKLIQLDAVKKTEINIKFLEEKADILKHMNEREKAIEVYNNALKLYENGLIYNSSTLEVKGDILKKLGRKEEAEKTYNDALVLIKQENDNKNDYGRIKDKIDGIKDFGDSEKIVDELLKDSKEGVNKKVSILKDDKEKIEECMLKLEETYNKDAFKELVKIYRTTNRSDKLLDFIENDLVLSASDMSDYLDARVERFKCLRDLGRKEEALDECEYIIYLNKNSRDNSGLTDIMTANKANLFRELGYKKQAYVEYLILSSYYPTNRYYRRNLQMLERELELKGKDMKKKKPYIFKNYTLKVTNEQKSLYKKYLVDTYKYTKEQLETVTIPNKEKPQLINSKELGQHRFIE